MPPARGRPCCPVSLPGGPAFLLPPFSGGFGLSLLTLLRQSSWPTWAKTLDRLGPAPRPGGPAERPLPRSAVTGARRGRPPGPAPRSRAPAHCPESRSPTRGTAVHVAPGAAGGTERAAPGRPGHVRRVPCGFRRIQTPPGSARTRCDCSVHRTAPRHLRAGEPSVAGPAGGSSQGCGRAGPGRAGLSGRPGRCPVCGSRRCHHSGSPPRQGRC